MGGRITVWDILIRRTELLQNHYDFSTHNPAGTLKAIMTPYIFPNSGAAKNKEVKNGTIYYRTVANKIQRLETDFDNDIAYYKVNRNESNPLENCIGFCTCNLDSHDDVNFEMNCVAGQNRACRQPIFVFQLKWEKHERPNLESVLEASMNAVTSLGMDEHQVFVSVHHHKQRIRSQITINRVHPNTYVPQKIKHVNKKLHFAARQSELKYGWNHSDGIYIVVFDDEQSRHKIVRNRKFKNK
ncbi:hypothetical protein AAKU67_003920 [Oxalobacteraceae bacterium GrIS 2.11]